MKLANKVAIITGAGSGIGKATAQLFAQEGAQVVVADINEVAAKNTLSEIETEGRQGMAIKVNIADSKQVNAAVKEAIGRCGKVDILVNNAGLDLIGRFTEQSEDEWDKLIAVTLKGAILFSRAVLDNMIERKYGKIINIASDAGRAGSGGRVVYGAVKGGIVSFTKGLAIEMARYGLNINCVSPGLINTHMLDHARNTFPKLIEGRERLVPWKRIGEPEEIASVILFLASDDSTYITGQTISVNGGLLTY